MLATVRTYALWASRPARSGSRPTSATDCPSFALVGLPDAAVRESRERVRAAIVNSGFEFPQQRITANLAPADLRKAGPGFDLAIAAAVLVATGQLAGAADRLGARRRAGAGRLDPARAAGRWRWPRRRRARRPRAIVVPRRCGAEAALVAARGGRSQSSAWPSSPTSAGEGEPAAPAALEPAVNGAERLPDLADLRGQPGLRRALEVAAAGGHSMLISGPPGAGKSMAARRLPSILPPLDAGRGDRGRRVASAVGSRSRRPDRRRPPFRAPHHTISTAGLIGGGNPPRPGEVTLAHRGVLFLDELGEFGRGVLEALRQPLEDGAVRIDARWRRLSCRAASSWSRRRTRAHAGAGRRSRAASAPRGGRARYGAGSAARSPTASTSSRCAGRTRKRWPVDGARARPTVRERVVAARERQRRRLRRRPLQRRSSREIELASCRVEPAALRGARRRPRGLRTERARAGPGPAGGADPRRSRRRPTPWGWTHVDAALVMRAGWRE